MPKIINQFDFGERHPIDARISSNMTQLQKEGLSTFTETSDSGLNSDDVNGNISKIYTIEMFPTMLKMISGTLVEGAKYSDVYVGTKMRKFPLPVIDMPVRILGSVHVLAHAFTGTGICI
jgi:hypothetical protein